MAISAIIQRIERPTLLLNKATALANIRRMASKTEKSGIRLRPHFKTHQSAEIGEWFREQGISAITVSSVEMAQYFVKHNWTDITIAFPVNLRQIRSLNKLATQVKLNLLFESVMAANTVDISLNARVGAWIKIDTGYRRTGIDWKNLAMIEDIAKAILGSRWLELRGLLAHAGHTYAATSAMEVNNIYTQTVSRMVAVQKGMRDHGIEMAISVGDTPGCCMATDLGAVDEIRPGNFVFFDLKQLEIGSCEEEHIAVALACPVVAKHPERNQLVIYGGAIHFSKESMRDKRGVECFGSVSLLSESGWAPSSSDSRLLSISQEHGLIEADPELFNSLEVGDLVAILPVHSCLTANLMGHYLTLDGDRIDMARY